jgi:hypothetical protein
MTSGGKKKCMFTHCAGRVVAGAMRELPSVEELVARIAWRGAARSRRAKHSFFGSSRSTIASMTKSASRAARSRSGSRRTRPTAASISGWLICPLATRRSRWPRFPAMALSRMAAERSLRVTA